MLSNKQRIALLFATATLWSSSSFAKSTEQVWNHHIEAWVQRDLAAIISDYDQESILIVNGKTYRGLEEIESVFSKLFAIFDSGENKIDPTVVEGRIVYITWHFTPPNDKEYFGTDTFVIEGGKIKVQTIASLLYRKYSVE